MLFREAYVVEYWELRPKERDLDVCPKYILEHLRTDDAVDKTGTFTGEGISEEEG